jgi:GT2 family glycosyltransferase
MPFDTPHGNPPEYGNLIAVARQPILSLVTPVYKPDENHFRLCANSVFGQEDPDWRWCVSVSGPVSNSLQLDLLRLEADPRVIIARSDEALGISANTNRALALVPDSHFALLDQDDILTPDAVSILRRIVRLSSPDIAYSDEAKTDDEGHVFDYFFKPDWSPARFASQMYVGHCLMLRTELVRQSGGFDPEFDGSQDYELVLRLLKSNPTIEHVDSVLYLWRVHSGSSASGHHAKPAAEAAALKALSRHLSRDNCVVSSFSVRPGVYQHRYAGVPIPPVSIIIPSAGLPSRRDPAQVPLHNILNALCSTTEYPSDLEIIVVADCERGFQEATGQIAQILERLEAPANRWKWRVIDAVRGPKEGFNFSRSVNYGALLASHDLLLLLNDDVQPRDRDWLLCLVESHEYWQAGAVGPLLIESSGVVSQAGIALSGTPINIGRGRPSTDQLPFSADLTTREVSAVTGAVLLVGRSKFHEVGGMDELFPSSFNDVDFCLKLKSLGYSCLFDPRSPMIHEESSTREPTVDADEFGRFFVRWGEELFRDPFYPNQLRIWNSNACDWSADFTVRPESATYHLRRELASTPLAWAEGYLDSNPDLRAIYGAGGEAGLHVLELDIDSDDGTGGPRSALVADKRRWPFEREITSRADLDELEYVKKYPDVKSAIVCREFTDGWQHWLEHGQFEDRIAPKRRVSWIAELPKPLTEEMGAALGGA